MLTLEAEQGQTAVEFFDARPILPSSAIFTDLATYDGGEGGVFPSNVVPFDKSSLARERRTQQQWAERLEEASFVLVRQAEEKAAHAPDSTSVAVRLAQTLVAHGDPQRALDAAHQAWTLILENGPDSPALYVLSQVYMYLGQSARARECLEMMGQHPLARLALANLYVRDSEPEKALALLSDMNSIEAQSLRGYILLTLNRPQQALAEFRAARTFEGVLSPTVLANMAYALASLGSHRKAARVASEAIAIDPWDPELKTLWAGICIRGGRYAEVASKLHEWRRNASSDVNGGLITAEVQALVRLQKLEEASRLARMYATGVRKVAQNSVSSSELAGFSLLLDYRMGKLSRAQFAIRSEELFNSSGRSSVRLASLWADAMYSRTSKTTSDIRKAYDELSVRVDRRTIIPLARRLSFLTDELEDQVSVAEEWVKLDPLDPHAVTGLVALLTDLDRFELAANIGLEGLQRFPFEDMLRNNTAYALGMLRRVDEARSVLRSVAIIDPYVAATRGLIELADGNIEAGLGGYRTAVSLLTEQIREERDQETVSALFGVQLRLVLKHLDLVVAADKLISAPLIDDQWRDRPDVEVMRRRAKRLNIPWV